MRCRKLEFRIPPHLRRSSQGRKSKAQRKILRRRHSAQSRSGELCDGERKRHSPPKYEGMPAREWHDIRSEFGSIFTFIGERTPELAETDLLPKKLKRE